MMPVYVCVTLFDTAQTLRIMLMLLMLVILRAAYALLAGFGFSCDLCILIKECSVHVPFFFFNFMCVQKMTYECCYCNFIYGKF